MHRFKIKLFRNNSAHSNFRVYQYLFILQFLHYFKNTKKVSKILWFQNFTVCFIVKIKKGKFFLGSSFLSFWMINAWNCFHFRILQWRQTICRYLPLLFAVMARNSKSPSRAKNNYFQAKMIMVAVTFVFRKVRRFKSLQKFLHFFVKIGFMLNWNLLFSRYFKSVRLSCVHDVVSHAKWSELFFRYLDCSSSHGNYLTLQNDFLLSKIIFLRKLFDCFKTNLVIVITLWFFQWNFFLETFFLTSKTAWTGTPRRTLSRRTHSMELCSVSTIHYNFRHDLTSLIDGELWAGLYSTSLLPPLHNK